MDSDAGQWSHLPKDLLAKIAGRLDTRIDFLHFRGVCSSWMSSVSPTFPSKNPLLSLKLPYPIASNANLNICDPDTRNPRGSFSLIESTLYYLQPLRQTPDSKEALLVKLEEPKPGKGRLMDTLSRCAIQHLPKISPRFSIPSTFESVKLVKLMVFVSLMFGGDEYGLMMIHIRGRLALWRLGEEKWSLIDDGAEKSHFDDVIYYKGRFYAIDYKGRIVVIDADSLKATELASPVHGSRGTHKHFVDDIVADVPDYPVHFEVFKFIEEEQKWDWVSDIGDRVLFVGDDRTFSLSSTDFPGFKGNCVYFTQDCFCEEDDDRPGFDAGIFDLEERIAGPLSAFPGILVVDFPLALRIA
ncbi:F-box protein SKIP23 [Vitis vinifera]|uniref:F-box protein SKIP23 n=1 Tax=Vitis vinifera TaxID=29760 RepID=A0A438EUZ8_VITVI|nr:F-box protein SKIP23 [Vitis vinifera]